MKSLIIAEKPSVATDIARVLGGMKKTGDFYEGENYIVANALGHLLEIVCPEEYEVKRGKWTFAHLPVLPPKFDLKPIARSGEKLKSLARLIKRKDVDCVINACDAGREGELIFRYIMQNCGNKKSIKRLWLQSMTAGAIQEAFTKLRTDEQMQPLADAARSRSEADWLVGINGTRAMTAFNSLDGGFFLTTVGRVQTPTLAVVVQREKEIRAFKPQNYWEVNATFTVPAGEYEAKWFNPHFLKDDRRPEMKADRLFAVEAVSLIVNRCQNQAGTVRESSKKSTMQAPQLFDLTSLQREANNRFGFSAKTTLAIAQALYEKHKALTYPRTDSRVLPEDYPSVVKQTMKMLQASQPYATFAASILSNNWVRPSKRIFDDTKISDHFAIIPTLQSAPDNLTEAETKVYDLVVKRFLAVFYPAAEYDVTTRITTVGEDHFKTEGKVLVNPGWKVLYGPQAVKENLVPLNGVSVAQTQSVQAQALLTKAPPRYTEATLLSAMEGAGKLVDDGELREAMADKGLGTPATRAAIIENLIDQKYIQREERSLRPTAKAQELFSLIQGLGIGELSDPKLTGEWEYKLSQIEKGKLTRDEFMSEIRDMTTKIVQAAKSYGSDTVPVESPEHLQCPCPKCGAEVVETYRRYACTNPNCDFSIYKHPAGRTFELNEVEDLMHNREIGPLEGFISKMGRPFVAKLRLTDDDKVEFVFPDSELKESEEDLSELPVVGQCPICGGRVLEGENMYFCEHVRGEKNCSFRCGRVVLQQPVDRDQIEKILTTGRSDLLENFVSNRNKRQFKAYLVFDKKAQKVGFEFEEKTPKTTKTTKEKTVKSKTATAEKTPRKKTVKTAK